MTRREKNRIDLERDVNKFEELLSAPVGISDFISLFEPSFFNLKGTQYLLRFLEYVWDVQEWFEGLKSAAISDGDVRFSRGEILWSFFIAQSFWVVE